MFQSLRARDFYYGVLILVMTGCVSCSGANKPSLKGLLDEMSGNCSPNGTASQKAKPASDPNDEIKAEVEVQCFPPQAPQVRQFFST
jgi:hypothetical protein